jgi:hypothetical protein
MTPTQKHRIILAVVAGCAVAAAVGVIIFLLAPHQSGGTSGTSASHGSSVALWIAIGTAVWVPLMATATRRRRERDKDKK